MEVPEGVTLTHRGRKYKAGMEVPSELKGKVKKIESNYSDKKKKSDNERKSAEEKFKKDKKRKKEAETKAANELAEKKAKALEEDGEKPTPDSSTNTTTGTQLKSGAGKP